jgi:hypothetical protein
MRAPRRSTRATPLTLYLPGTIAHLAFCRIAVMTAAVSLLSSSARLSRAAIVVTIFAQRARRVLGGGLGGDLMLAG